MDLFAFTRRLIDIESISGNERAVGERLLAELTSLGLTAAAMPVEPGRFNIYAHAPGVTPQVVLSTHMDTVPPFLPSSEDETRIYGRGSCDAKGIIVAMTAAVLRLQEEKIPAGLLFLVGEERDSLGAQAANDNAPQPRPRILINGEPTENRVALASKGALRLELTARGRMAHSAYPELGDSAINKLVHALHAVLALKFPEHPTAGPTTVNIGIVEGGRAPNVIADHARAELLFRLVGPKEPVLEAVRQAVGELVEVAEVLHIPFVELRSVEGLPTFIAAFTTDIPRLSNWGEPVLLGPGSILVAHTDGEFIEKKQLLDAVDLYCDVARRMLGKNPSR